MKTNKYQTFRSLLLLICFIAGQYIVYNHQHNIARVGRSYNKARSQQTITEKCALCDVMHHHNAMVKPTPANFNPVATRSHVFKSLTYSVINIQLIRSGGRAPPTAITVA